MTIKLKKGDTVTVLTGKDKGKKGKVLKVFPVQGRAVVEKINMVKKHQRPTQQQQQGGIVEKEASVALSNLQIVCSKCGAATRVKKERTTENKNIRVCKKCGEEL